MRQPTAEPRPEQEIVPGLPAQSTWFHDIALWEKLQLAEEHAHGEFAKYDAERLRRAAIERTSDFDKIVDEVKQLEAPPLPPLKPKQPVRKKKDGGE